jgi:predicted AlkP superfamily pyrophosphatase or phosphodiesterase
VHTSIATGCYPDRHGIYGNLDFKVGNHEQPWAWGHKHVKVPDIFTAAKKAGLTTAAVFWPVTGNHPDIDYLCDEYWTQGKADTHMAAFQRMGSSPEVLGIIKRYEKDLIDRVHPSCDYFILNVASDIIVEYKPDLMMIHPADIDAYRHHSGVFGPMVRKGIEDTDRYIGMVMQAAEKAGTLDETNLCLVSDHGQMDIKRVMNLNVKFVQAGLIRLDAKGEIRNWDAYCLSGGLSALVYLKDRGDKAVYEKTYHLLRELCDEGVYGISQVFTEEEADKEERFGGDFSFVLETDGYTSFADNWLPPLVTSFDTSDYRSGHATHGYLPEKGPQPVFVAKGPAFKKEYQAPWHHIVDEAPTFAKILGCPLPGCDGSSMDELLAGSGK